MRNWQLQHHIASTPHEKLGGWVILIQMVCVHDSTGIPLSCYRACMQTAFKRSSPTSATDTASANEGGETRRKDRSVSGEAPSTDGIDWDSVKPDDKSLVFQVCNIPVWLSVTVWVTHTVVATPVLGLQQDSGSSMHVTT